MEPVDDTYSLKLRLSKKSQDNLHMPFVWRRRVPRVYNYHHQVSHTYYDPLLEYISTGQKVELPDRAQANYNRVRRLVSFIFGNP